MYIFVYIYVYYVCIRLYIRILRIYKSIYTYIACIYVYIYVYCVYIQRQRLGAHHPRVWFPRQACRSYLITIALFTSLANYYRPIHLPI